MTIGKRIKEYRKSKGWTQKKLAKESGLAEITIRQYENESRTPQTTKLKQIADALEVTITDLMGVSNYLDEVENEMRQATNFYDYLASLGYIILEVEHENATTIYLKTLGKSIELNSDDVELLKKLENNTETSVKNTIEWLLAAKKQ